MSAERLNPPDLYPSIACGFSHAVLARGTRTIHGAGEVARDREHRLVGEGDLGAQTVPAPAKLRAVPAAAGATPADVVRLRTFVVNHTPDRLGIIGPALAAIHGTALPAANTVVGVQALALPGFRVETEADAVLD